jgi:hypothetical protein
LEELEEIMEEEEDENLIDSSFGKAGLTKS